MTQCVRRDDILELQTLHNADEYYNMGVEQYYHKRYQGAIDNFTRAIELVPNDSDMFFSRGLAKLLLHQNKEALDDFLKAMELGEIIPTKYLDECGWVK